MQHIRILLGGMPPLLHDIVSDLVGRQDDMHIVGEMDADGSLQSSVRRYDADVVILGVATSDVPVDVQDLVYEQRGTKVLAVESDGRHAWLYELRPHQVRIGEVSPKMLIDTIRAATASAPAQVHRS